jgi:hypothetical protein
MPTKYVANDTYTDAELLALFRECYARISVSGQSYQMTTPGGGTTTFTAADLPRVRDQIDKLQAAVNGASGSIWADVIMRMGARS